MEGLQPQASSPAPVSQSAPRDVGVTGRVIVLALLLAVFFGWLIPLIDDKMGNTYLGGEHLAPGAVGTLLVLLLVVNPMLRTVNRVASKRWWMLGAAVLCALISLWGWKHNFANGFALYVGAAGAFFMLLAVLFGRPLSRNEMLTMYISCLFSCIIPGHGSENFVVSNLVAPFYFATPENKWLNAISANIPAWASPVLWADPAQKGASVLSPVGRKVADGYYLGAKGIPWGAWLVPLLFWVGFVLLSYVMLGCLSLIVRAQWAQNEALSFPLNQLPLELTEDVNRPDLGWGRFFRNPLTWIGVSIAVFIQMVNGLHLYVPDLFPVIQGTIDTGPLFTAPPWNQMGWTPIILFPLAIGIAFLLTSEIGFSLWFFALLMRLQFIGAYWMGYAPTIAGGRDFTTYQTVGAFFAYALLVLWTGRLHYTHVAKRAFGRARKGGVESQEVVSYPIAFWGFVLSLAGVMGLTHLLGANWGITFLLWGTYLAMCIGLTRLVVEGGLLYVGNQWRVIDTWAPLTGASTATWLPASSIAPATLVQSAFMLDMRAFILPSFVQGWKLAYDNGLHLKRLLGLIASIILIAVGLGFYRRVEMAYLEGGALTWQPFVAKNGSTIWATSAKSLGQNSPVLNFVNWFWLLVGALLTWGMLAMRARYAWFPLHPLGYLIPLSYPMICLWMPIFIGWSFKALITRYGGISAYRSIRPLFLGVVVGDIFMVVFWLLFDGWVGRTFHFLLPN